MSTDRLAGTSRRLSTACALIAVVIAACAAPAAPPTSVPASPPAFDLAVVKANFVDECKDPVVVTDEFCEQVVISALSAAGEILNVPTRLKPGDRDAAKLLCNLFVLARFDVSGQPLGYQVIGIVDSSGGNLYACTVQ